MSLDVVDELEDDELDMVEFTATALTYRTFNEAYDLFNQSLFAGELPECLITLQRRKNSRGYFGHQKFEHRGATEGEHYGGNEIVDEIALNPETFRGRTDREIASTLLHEMVHCWQQHFGKPSRSNYHNRQWADKMVSLGLIPSQDGQPGGRQTGQSMTHYIVAEGVFDREWQLMEEAGFRFYYQDRNTNHPERAGKAKVRYTCSVCAISVWGKPELHIMCESCQQHMG